MEAELLALKEMIKELESKVAKEAAQKPPPRGVAKDRVIKTFSRNLRRAMNLKGMSYADLSRVSGIPDTTISNWTRLSRAPSIYMVARLATALGVRPGTLLRGLKCG